MFSTACLGHVSSHPGVKCCADLEQGHSQLSGAVEEGKLAEVFALGPAPRGCADPVPLNKAKLMSYTCVAIVFTAVFVVNTLAAATMSGVFCIGAKKTALTKQPQHSRGCQVEKPSDAGKQSNSLSPLQVCDLHSLRAMETQHPCGWVMSVVSTKVNDRCLDLIVLFCKLHLSKVRVKALDNQPTWKYNSYNRRKPAGYIGDFFLIALNYSQYQWFPVTSSFWTLLDCHELWCIQFSIPDYTQATVCLRSCICRRHVLAGSWITDRWG